MSAQSLQLEGKCSVMISDATGARTYRSYFFFSNGVMQVFNTFAREGADSKTSGARNYFFFPRKQNPKVEFLSDGRIDVVMASGERTRFAGNGRISSMTGAKFVEAPEIRRDNGGGLEIPSILRGIVLDTGFSIGKPAYANPKGKSTFRDANGETCELPNSDIFIYRGTDEVTLEVTLPQDDALIGAFLTARCPNLTHSLDAAPGGSYRNPFSGGRSYSSGAAN